MSSKKKYIYSSDDQTNNEKKGQNYQAIEYMQPTSFSSVPGKGSPSRSHGWQLINSFHFPVISNFGSSAALYTYPSTSYRPAL